MTLKSMNRRGAVTADKTKLCIVLRAICVSAINTFCLSGCSKPIANPSAAPPAPAIAIVKPQKQSIRRVIEQPASLMPDEETHIHAKLPGYVRKVYVDIGHRVIGPKYDTNGRETTPGALLAELTIPELQEEAKQKHAHVQLALAQVQQQRKGVASAEAQVGAAEALVEEAKAGFAKAQAHYERWESESKRLDELVGGGLIDAQTRDEVQSQFKASEAARQEAKAKIASTEAQVRKSRADRGQAEADLKAAEAKLGVHEADARRVEALVAYSKIRAPFDGVVTVRRVNTGDLLTTSANRPSIFTIARLDPIRAVVHVPEADAGLVGEGSKIALSFPTMPGAELETKVARTSWSLDPTSRTLRVEVDLPNAEGRFRPGMYATAKIMAELPASWTVPHNAVVSYNDLPSCFFVEDGKAKRMELRLGRGDGQRIELKTWRRFGTTDSWVEIKGNEQIGSPGNKIVENQDIAEPTK